MKIHEVFWKDHPITTTEMCTFFPVVDFVLYDTFLPMEARNCPPTNGDDSSSSICYGFETDNRSDSGSGGGKVEFLDDTQLLAIYVFWWYI